MSLFARLFGTRTPADVEARIIPVLQMMAIDGALQMAQDENPGKDMQSDFAAARAALVMVALAHLRQS